MTIKVELFGNEFKRDGVLKDTRLFGGKYDSLKIVRSGNGRLYMMALNSKINGKVGMINKQMQFENGQVYLSFGKNDKLVIGTYTEQKEVI
jgi:hypothetical protein